MLIKHQQTLKCQQMTHSQSISAQLIRFLSIPIFYQVCGYPLKIWKMKIKSIKNSCWQLCRSVSCRLQNWSKIAHLALSFYPLFCIFTSISCILYFYVCMDVDNPLHLYSAGWKTAATLSTWLWFLSFIFVFLYFIFGILYFHICVDVDNSLHLYSAGWKTEASLPTWLWLFFCISIFYILYFVLFIMYFFIFVDVDNSVHLYSAGWKTAATLPTWL